VVPRWPVFVAEAGEQVVAAFFQNSVNPLDELLPIHNFHVVEASYIKNKIELLVSEGEGNKAFSFAYSIALCEISIAVTSKPFSAR
jgi:hypothetical protein